MNAKLIWITPDAEKIIGYCARVSNPANQDNPDYTKLLKYCVKNAHNSVFEMSSACVEIKCSRTIARQILRHRSFSFQEFSQRYQSLKEDDFLITPVEARAQDSKNRQNSTDTLSQETKDWWVEKTFETQQLAFNNYQEALCKGIAKECARVLLPEGLTPSTMYMSGTIRSWMHYLQVRLGNGTQKEHVDVARAILAELTPHIPTVIDAMGLEND
jgi:thymidylate synthase (FAD)